MTDERAIREGFFERGFYGPFKVYEPEEANRIIMEVRKNALSTDKAIFQNSCNYDRHFDIDALARHVVNGEIVRHVRAILGENLLCWRTEFFPKFPGAKGTEWHQVERFQYTTGSPQLQPRDGKPGDDPFELTVWTSFTESTVENGCLKFLPGSHFKKYYDETITPKTGRGERYSPVVSETSFFGYNFSEFKVDPDWEPSEDDAVSMVMRPGEAVVFTARCVHGSHPNSTKNKTRFALSSRYVSTDVMVYPTRQNFVEHGGYFDLSQYGAVLVSGRDEYGLNRLRAETNTGFQFPAPA
jgi:non-haem Fe2+, alpha-ketoglutarate-dependent halogenase